MLRVFDNTYDFGPCVGMTRLERWERAETLGLNPPPEVKLLFVFWVILYILTNSRYGRFFSQNKDGGTRNSSILFSMVRFYSPHSLTMLRDTRFIHYCCFPVYLQSTCAFYFFSMLCILLLLRPKNVMYKYLHNVSRSFICRF